MSKFYQLVTRIRILGHQFSNNFWHYLFPPTNPQSIFWPPLARWIQWVTFFWIGVGLWILLSSSFSSAQWEFQDGFYYVRRQLVWILLGIAVFNILTNCPMETLLKISHWGIIGAGLAVIYTVLKGVAINGSSRWVQLGPLLFQPSELVKPFLILEGAKLFGNWAKLSWSRRCIWLGWLVLIVVGILLQPNLSTSALCGSLLWWLACWSGISWIYLSLIGLGGLSLAGISLSLKAYQRSRIISFLNPWNYSTDEGYQLVQSLLAIGSGGLSGTGWGLSYQKLFYLPIQSTDFIFAVFAEELGFLGSWLFFFFILSYSVLGIKLIILTKEPIHRLVALGSIMILIGQTLMNVGVTVGLLPTTGLPMPFWSYGGNAMISSLIVASFLIQIAKENYSD